MPRQKRRKGLKKIARTSRFERDLLILKKANKLVTGLSLDARRWLKSNIA